MPRRPRVYVLALFAIVAFVVMATVAACGGATPTPTPRAANPTPTPSAGGATPTPSDPSIAPTPSFDAAAYFTGKTIRVITGTSPGGGYDIFARIFSAVAPDHIPGRPRFVVENRPGAGQLLGLQVTMRAKADGYTMGLMHPRFPQSQILGNPVDGFNLDTVTILGSPTNAAASSEFCVRRSVATSWDAVLALGRQITSGETAPGNSPGPEFLGAINGPVRNVYGYGGSAEIMAAFDRGELDATTRCGPELVLRLYPDWVDRQYFVPLFYYGDPPDFSWSAQFGVPNLRHIFDVVNPTPDQRAAFDAYLALVRSQRVFVMPPNVPEPVTAFWRGAFNATVSDQRFIDAVGAAGYGSDYELGTAQQVIESFESGRGLSAEARTLLQAMTGQ